MLYILSLCEQVLPPYIIVAFPEHKSRLQRRHVNGTEPVNQGTVRGFSSLRPVGRKTSPTKAAFPAAAAHACAALQISINITADHADHSIRQPPVSHADDACFLPAVASDRVADGPTIQETTSTAPPLHSPHSGIQCYRPPAPNPDQAQAQVQTRIQIAISTSRPWRIMGPSPRATTPATGGTGYVWSASGASHGVFAVD